MQLSLPFRISRQPEFAQFIPPDTPVVAWLRDVSATRSAKALLVGGRGTGKTHLLAATCQYVSRANLSVAYVPLTEAKVLAPEMLQGLEAHDLVCVDDLQLVAALPDWEMALFNLYNACDDTGARLLFSARGTPAEIGISLLDLVSRLSAMVVLKLAPLADVDLAEAMRARAASAAFTLPVSVAEYLLRRLPRDMHVLASVTDRLAQLSLAEKCLVTMPVVRAWHAAGVLELSEPEGFVSGEG